MDSIGNFSHLTDEQLVEKIIITKNDLLFGILYERYSNFVFNKCYGFANTRAEAQDLTQEVFVKLYLKLRKFEGKSKFSTWMYSFTYNMCVDYVNKKTLDTVRSDSIDKEDFEYLQIEIDDYSLFHMKTDILKRAMENISPEDKMVLLLKYQDELPIKDIIYVLDIGESAVKMRLKRAKARIVEAYNNLI